MFSEVINSHTAKNTISGVREDGALAAHLTPVCSSFKGKSYFQNRRRLMATLRSLESPNPSEELSIPASRLETRIRNQLLRAHLLWFVATCWYFKLRVIKSRCCCVPAELEIGAHANASGQAALIAFKEDES